MFVREFANKHRSGFENYRRTLEETSNKHGTWCGDGAKEVPITLEETSKDEHYILKINSKG